MRRYLKIFRAFFSSSFRRELEFRANFFAKVLQNVVWMVFFILILKVIYLNTDSVAGWSEANSYVLMATCFLMNAIVVAFAGTSLHELPERIRKGTLDFDIVKPIDVQFLISMRRFQFDELGTFLVGIAMLLIGVGGEQFSPGLVATLGYCLLLLCSVAIFYSFQLMLMTTGIWLVRVDNLWVLGESLFTVARYPIDIFSSSARRVLTYVIPLAFIATVPSRILIEQLSASMVALALFWAAAFLLISRAFWVFALRYYTSASS